MSQVETRNTNRTIIATWDVSNYKPDGRRCLTADIALHRESMDDEAGYSVWCLNLPGVASQGETPDEALKNIREAIRGAVLTYEELGMEWSWIPGHLTEYQRGVERLKISVELPPKGRG